MKTISITDEVYGLDTDYGFEEGRGAETAWKGTLESEEGRDFAGGDTLGDVFTQLTGVPTDIDLPDAEQMHWDITLTEKPDMWRCTIRDVGSMRCARAEGDTHSDALTGALAKLTAGNLEAL